MRQQATTLLTGILIGLFVAGLLLLLLSQPRKYGVELQPPPTPEPLMIHVAGAVQNPGVYELPLHAIIADAIKAAGGASEGANLDRVNLAASLKDNQQVFVPSTPEKASREETSQSSPVTTSSEKINVNTGTISELDQLPGIGPSLAEEIIKHRETFGIFHEAADLLDVSGIGPAKLEKISELVSFD
ncbi:MAG: ComEA family DNA-binding protein [Anaerolineales bacterium]